MSDPTSLAAADGTQFAIQTETVRHEGTFHSLMRRDVGAPSFVRDGVYDETSDKRTAVRRLRKRVAEWNAELERGYTPLHNNRQRGEAQ